MKGKQTNHLIAFLILFLFAGKVTAQNLCPNPGFEQLTGCPSMAGEISLASPWTGAGIDSDLFNFCSVNGTPAGCDDVSVPVNFAGFSNAFTGSSYAGFYTKKSAANKRTYVQAPLNSPMTSSTLYRVTARFRRSSASRYATNRVAIAFSTSALTQIGGIQIPIIPQIEVPFVIADTSQWTEYTSYYEATGGEAFITIGNFKSDAATSAFNFSTPIASCNEMNSSAFYYVDEIEVVEITEQLTVSGDTTICIGDSTVLTGTTNTSGWWSEISTPNDTIQGVNNSITVSPVDTTTYVWNGVVSTLEITVYTNNPPVTNLLSDTTLCDGESVILNVTGDGTDFSWSTGDTTQFITVSDSGIYIVTVGNGYCFTKDTSLVSVLPTPEIVLPLSGIVCPDNDEFFPLDAGPGDAYSWIPGGDTTQVVNANAPGIWTVTVTHGNGCTRTASTMIEEVCPSTLFFPGAFTPNNDGKNELFFGTGTNFSDYNLKIFNRWGQLVYETEFPGDAGGWNGTYNNTDAPAGLYTFIVTYSTEKAGGKKKIEKESGYFLLWR